MFIWLLQLHNTTSCCKNHLNHRATCCKTLLFQTIVFVVFFLSPTASSLPHESNVKPQLLQHKQKHRKQTCSCSKANMYAMKKILYSCCLKKKQYIIIYYTQASANNWQKLQYAQQTFISTLKTVTITTSYWVPQKRETC